MDDVILNVGVIGLGRMGGCHVRNLAHHVGASEVVAIMDPDKELAKVFAKECAAAIFTDALELINDETVDAVVIASPDPTHPDLAIACIEAGKPVLCEKPLGIDIAGANRVLEAEVASGRRLVQVGLMRIYDPQHTALKQALDDGVASRPLLFRGIHKNARVGNRVRTAVDVIVNSAVHDIHSARWFLKDDVSVVYANHIIDVPERPETARFVLLQMKFRGGGLATIEVDADSYGYEVNVDISGK